MKKKVRILILSTLCLMGGALLWSNQQPANELFIDEIEALTSEGGAKVWCECSSAGECVADGGSGYMCATGKNMECWHYMRNCSGRK